MEEEDVSSHPNAHLIARDMPSHIGEILIVVYVTTLVFVGAYACR